MKPRPELRGPHKFKILANTTDAADPNDEDRDLCAGDIVVLDIKESHSQLAEYLVPRYGGYTQTILWKELELVEESIESTIGVGLPCTCEMMVLMRSGCKCGGV